MARKKKSRNQDRNNISIKLGKEKECNNCEIDRKYKHVERCDIEFSDIYN